MSYLEAMLSGHNNPKLLENLYQTAQQENKISEFVADLRRCYQQAPDDVLFAAWYYRLQQTGDLPDRRSINWKLAIPLAVTLNLIFWILSLEDLGLRFTDGAPYLIQVWALIGAAWVILFLTFTAKKQYKQTTAVLVGFLIFGAYALAFSILPNDRNYQILAAVHLPLLAWIGVGVTVLWRQADHANRFAFLIKSIEVFVVGGIYVIGGAVFVAMTYALFETIEVRIPEQIERLLFPGGIGLIILLAAASTYDPLIEPMAQNFHHGLSKLVSTVMRLLLPLSLLVLVIFTYFVLQPDNFWIPFNNRDALITYNAMLFAIVLLLVGAIPLRADDLPPKTQSMLRFGIMAVAILTVLVSLYAMSATIYRTYLGVITMNRMAVIGWNTINIGILALLIYRLIRSGPKKWIISAQSAFSTGMWGYIFWAIFVILSTPFIFGQGLATGWVRPTQTVETSRTEEALKPTTQPDLGQVGASPPREMAMPTPTPSGLTKLPGNCPPACSATNLAGAYLPEIDLSGVDLMKANLSEANLEQANLRGANLRGANLRGTDLQGANLEHVSLHETKIDHATKLDDKWRLVWQIVNQGAEKRNLRGQNLNLRNADLSGANLRGAILAFGSLRGADLRGVDLSGANLNNISLHEALIDETTKLDDKWRLVWQIVNQGAGKRDLSGVNLSQADLSQADLSQADLSRAILTDTNLSNANLYGADLRGAILTESDPEGGPPRQAMLDQADLVSVKLDDTTQIEDKWRLVWEIVNQGAKNRDLSGADLSGADLREIDLSGAVLVDARLNGANLRDSNLQGADLNGARLNGADLSGANLTGANFFEAQLIETRLPTDLGGTNFRKANLRGANLWGFNLSGLNLSRADLRGANLAEADLRQANLSEAHLEGAYLWRANLGGANMRGVYLNDAYLWGASLEGADLMGAEIYQAVLPEAMSDE